MLRRSVPTPSLQGSSPGRRTASPSGSSCINPVINFFLFFLFSNVPFYFFNKLYILVQKMKSILKRLWGKEFLPSCPFYYYKNTCLCPVLMVFVLNFIFPDNKI